MTWVHFFYMLNYACETFRDYSTQIHKTTVFKITSGKKYLYLFIFISRFPPSGVEREIRAPSAAVPAYCRLVHCHQPVQIPFGGFSSLLHDLLQYHRYYTLKSQPRFSPALAANTALYLVTRERKILNISFPREEIEPTYRVYSRMQEPLYFDWLYTNKYRFEFKTTWRELFFLLTKITFIRYIILLKSYRDFNFAFESR